jgi:uncharacterized FAD-dependent dehydrogenase
VAHATGFFMPATGLRIHKTSLRVFSLSLLQNNPMGYTQLSLKLPPDYTPEQLQRQISKKLHIHRFSFQILHKSLDARKKSFIHWKIRLLIQSPEIKGGEPALPPQLSIPSQKTNKKAVVLGSGPAGFFAAYVLQKGGVQTLLIERGTEVDKRSREIETFEKTARFFPKSNYAFGEGGAGTFSDGKLTSRSKHISLERQFILNSYVEAGGPEEIRYLSHPHLGTDNLKSIVKNLRKFFTDRGGKILFETQITDLQIKGNTVTAVDSHQGLFEADYFILAPGHSAFDTFRMLMKKGVRFHVKNFALGSRMEHPQELINRARWGVAALKGVKAVEYRLTSPGEAQHPVYSFCMCPGGTIVPATAYPDNNIVNGMSRYMRNGKFANAAVVAGLNLNRLLKKEVSAAGALDWLEKLEQHFYHITTRYRAPFCSIQSFLKQKPVPATVQETSYPMGTVEIPLWELFPEEISRAIRHGLHDFSKKMKGFETGNLLGLESKTSAPIQADREKNGKCAGFDNLYLVGEGSGYSGGIISSAADGIKAAMDILNNI